MIEKEKAVKIGLLVTGVALLFFGFIIPQFWRNLLLAKFYREVSLRPGTLAYKRFTGAKDPIKSTFYFWNWTNPGQITDEDIKPHFVEMGPYIFWQFRERVNLTYNSENATVSYRDKYSFYFDSELSNGSLSDEVTSINTVAATAAYMTRNWSNLILYPLTLLLQSNGQQIWWRKTVGELLFDGFENPVQKLSSLVPGLVAPDKFAYFYGVSMLNGTVQPGLFNIDSGENDVNKIAQIYFLNYKNESDLYPDCKEINGTNEDFFAPLVTPETKLEFYRPEVCRRLVRYYDGESTYEGLKTYVFSGTNKSFDSGVMVPENKCYCLDDDCPRSGVLDVSKCLKGPPIYSSMPHFYSADPYYRNRIEGMNPVESKHKLYSELEPTTGVQVNMRIRLQINVRLTRNPGLSLYRNVPDILIPVFWQDYEILLKGKYLIAIKLLVFFLQYGSHIWYGIGILGAGVTAAVVTYHFYNKNSLKRINRNIMNRGKQDAEKEEEQKLKNEDTGEKEKKAIKYILPDNN